MHLFLVFLPLTGIAQSVSIGTPTPDPSALLHLQSDDKGLLLPALSSTSRLAIPAPAPGLLLYDFNTKSLWTRNPSNWAEIYTSSNSPWVEENGNVYRSTGFVGVGTATPFNKLHVHYSILDSNFIRISNSVTGPAGNRGLIAGLKGLNASLLNLENGKLVLGSNNDSAMAIDAAGRVGIGTLSPLANLQVNGNSLANVPSLLLADSSADGLPKLVFQNLNTTRKMTLRGNSLNNFSNGLYLDVISDSLTVASFAGTGRLGLKNSNPLYTLDVSGDINTTGLLRVNGNAGTNGQVLTSTGPATDPEWRNAAFNNDTRFMYKSSLPGSSTLLSDSIPLSVLVYNTNTTNIVLSSNGKYITINKTGLYHFEGVVAVSVGLAIAQSVAPVFTLELRTGSNTFLTQFDNVNFETSTALPAFSWRINTAFDQDIYLTAGSTIALSRLNTNTPGGSTLFLDYHFSGYLISE